MAVFAGALLVAAHSCCTRQQSSAKQGAALVRGNKPGEWRYWGADAWSTRYSALDQINATNFDSLQVAWQWNAGAVRRGRVLSHDAALRERPALHRRDDAAQGVRDRSRPPARRSGSGRIDEGIRWQKAPRQFAGRGLAYWTDGTDERVDRRHAGLPPGDRSTRRRARAIRSVGKDGVVDLMEGLGFPLVPLAVDDSDSLEHQRGRAGAKGEAGREVECRRRRPAPTARSASIRRTDRSPQLAADHRRRRDRRRQLVDPRLLPDHAAQHSRAPSAASTSTPASSSGSSISFRSPVSSARTRGRTARRSARRASARTMRGRPTRPIPSSASSTSRSACRSPTSTAAIVRATICSATASSRST